MSTEWPSPLNCSTRCSVMLSEEAHRKEEKRTDASALLVRIIPSSDSSHAGGLIARIGLQWLVQGRPRIRSGFGDAPVLNIRSRSQARLGNTYRSIQPGFNDQGGKRTHTQMFLVQAMCGHLWGLLMTATTAICCSVSSAPGSSCFAAMMMSLRQKPS